MNLSITERVLKEAEYILKTNQTVRQLAQVFKISKSTVHKDLHERLKEINPSLFEEVDKILQYHIDVRHIRGGQSTKQKYKKGDINDKRYWNRLRNS